MDQLIVLNYFEKGLMANPQNGGSAVSEVAERFCHLLSMFSQWIISHTKESLANEQDNL